LTTAFTAKQRKGIILIDATGTTLTLIATDAFTKYQSLTGATIDKNTKSLLLNLRL
jgi:hypothetical protein